MLFSIIKIPHVPKVLPTYLNLHHTFSRTGTITYYFIVTPLKYKHLKY